MEEFFLIVDQAKNTLYIPVCDCMRFAIKEYGQNIKEHRSFKELDKTIHNFVIGANDED